MHRCAILVIIIILLTFLIHRYDCIKMQSRQLWIDHISITREYFIAVVNSQPRKHITEYLIQNQDCIGQFLGRFYGKDFGNKAADLLKQHIGLVAKVADGDQTASADMYKNGDQIADALAMPRKHMKAHLDSTIAEFTHLKESIAGGVTSSYNTWEIVYKEALKMSDSIVRRVSFLPWKLLY